MENEIQSGKQYYYPKMNIKVTVTVIDGDYAYVRGANDKLSFPVHISELRELADMNGDDILEREG